MKIIQKKKIFLSKCNINEIKSSNYQYLGIILCHKSMNKIKNIKKILLNMTYIYLKNNNFFFIQEISHLDIIDITYMYNILKNTFNLLPPNIDFHKIIYQSNKINIYMVAVNNLTNIDIIDNYSWRRFIDFYQYYFIDKQDLYESIYFRTKNPNIHLNYELSNEYNINIQLDSLYSSMIGEYAISYNKIDKIKVLKDIK